MSTLHACCAVEGDYVPHSAAMLDSLLAHRGNLDIQVHYLHGPELPARHMRLLSQMLERAGAEISFREIPDDALEGLPIEGFTLKATWYRIFLPELLPDLDHILYLDTDTIVMDDVSELWGTDVSDHFLAAVTNVWQWNHAGRPAELGLPPNVYFNAGVLLLNLDQMRRHDCSAALMQYGIEHASDLAFRDQDALNVVLSERRVALHPRWNCMNATLLFPAAAEIFGAAAVEEARRNPGIRHFEGPGSNKPWHFLCAREMRDLYAQHRRQTPWPRVQVEGRTGANLLRKASGRARGARLRRQ